MFVSLLLTAGVLSIPIWGIVFCLNFIALIEKIKDEEYYTKNAFWFTCSFVIIVTVLTFAVVSS